MAITESRNGHPQLAPPTNEKLEVANKLSLVLRMMWINLLVLPLVLWTFCRKLFPPKGKSLRGQVVVVTGAGRGLGKGLALKFAEEGCKVAVADINIDNAEQTAAEITRAGGLAKAYFTNVAKVEEVRALHKAVSVELGSVDILVNNAGLIHGMPIEDYTEDSINAVISVNLKSHFWMIREFLPEMKERNSGHIVAVASVSSLVGLMNAGAYVACKFGVRGIMETVRLELESKKNNNIKTTTVFPYFINTSADYVKHWNIRLPAISIEDTAKATIDAIKREEVSVTIPGYLYFALLFCSLLPQYIVDQYNNLFYAEVIPPTREEQEALPTTYIINDLANHKHA